MDGAVATVLGAGALGAATGAGSATACSSRLGARIGPSPAVWVCVSFTLMVFTWIGLMVSLASTVAADLATGATAAILAAGEATGGTVAVSAFSAGADGTNLEAGQAVGGENEATV